MRKVFISKKKISTLAHFILQIAFTPEEIPITLSVDSRLVGNRIGSSNSKTYLTHTNKIQV